MGAYFKTWGHTFIKPKACTPHAGGAASCPIKLAYLRVAVMTNCAAYKA